MIDRRALLAGGTAAAMALAWPAPALAVAGRQINGLLDSHRVPGTSLAVIERGSIVWAEGYGTRIEGEDAPVATSTRFQAASLSKTINALAVLALVRDGKVDLDAPVNSYLNGWRLKGPSADAVTVAHLLSHTGATTVSGFGGYRSGSDIPNLRQILNGAAPANSGAIENTGRPGRAYAYSGGGITVLQKLVEDQSGLDYANAVLKLVLTPLDMRDSTMRILPADDTLAAGHDASGLTIHGQHNDYPESAAAGLWTTPTDMAKAMLAVMEAHRGGGFISRALARRMLTPTIDGAGLGTFGDGKGSFSHSGVNWGFRALYWGHTERRIGYAIMSNGENGGDLHNDLANVIARQRGW